MVTKLKESINVGVAAFSVGVTYFNNEKMGLCLAIESEMCAEHKVMCS